MPNTGSPSWDALYATAELQAGYFTTAQGAEAGYSPQLLYKHVKAGRVRRVRRGIYRLVHFPMSDEEHKVECWLWAEHTGVFSHETALFYYDLSDVLPEHVYLTVPEVWRRRRFRVPEGLVLRYGHVPEAERTWLGPVPITKPARAIRDVIDTHLSPEHVERALAEVHHRGLIGGKDLYSKTIVDHRRQRPDIARNLHRRNSWSKFSFGEPRGAAPSTHEVAHR